MFVRELIEFRVDAILKQYFDIESLAYSMLFEKYWSWFYVTYSEMDIFHGRNYSLRGMAEPAIEYVEWSIAQVNYFNVPMTVPVVAAAPQVDVTPERVNSACEKKGNSQLFD